MLASEPALVIGDPIKSGPDSGESCGDAHLDNNASRVGRLHVGRLPETSARSVGYLRGAQVVC